jgi:hypothetical protein
MYQWKYVTYMVSAGTDILKWKAIMPHLAMKAGPQAHLYVNKAGEQS